MRVNVAAHVDIDKSFDIVITDSGGDSIRLMVDYDDVDQPTVDNVLCKVVAALMASPL